MTAIYLRRGMAAGLLAGLLAGLFAFFVGEPLLDRAVEIEHASGAHGELVSRAVQKAGLFFATGATGLFVGGLFGLAFAYFGERLSTESDWTRSLSLAGAVFVGLVLIPFLKYPANPPSVGDPATIRARTAAYLALVGLSLLSILVSWFASRNLRKRGVGQLVRQVIVGMGLVAVVVVLFAALPAAVDPGKFPAGLLWSFRLSSLGTQVVLWTGIGTLFGGLCERTNRKGAF